MDLISVIVPIYNVEQYLRQCLDSLTVQTYKNIEVIMVDDGSPDNCGAICDEYAEKYNNFIAVHKENAGLGMARNTGLENAHGQYVIFIDSDDYISDSLIEDLYKELKLYQVDVCIGGFECTVEGQRNVQYESECFPGEKARTELLPRMIGSLPDKKDSVEMCVCGVLYNMEPVREHNILFPSERELISEDLIFNIDYMQYANGAYLSSTVGYYYNVNLSSLTRSYRKDFYNRVKRFYLDVERRLSELNYDNIADWRSKRIFFVYVKSCISQEANFDNDFGLKQRLSNIGSICGDSVLQEAIREYPVNKLGFAQRTFLFMVKHKWTLALYLFFMISGK